MSVSTEIDLTQDHMDEGIECDTPQTPFMDEGLFDDDDLDAMSTSSSSSLDDAESVHILGASPQSFQSQKRPRVDEPAEPFEMHIYNVASIELSAEEPEPKEPFEMQLYNIASILPSIEEPEPAEPFEMQIYNVAAIEPAEEVETIQECQPRDIQDLISGLDFLEAKEKEEQESITKELAQLKESIPINETQIVGLGPEVKCEVIAKWNQTLKSHKKRCTTMQNGRAFFENKQQEEIDNPNSTTIETIHRYDARIAECVESIKHVEEQIENKKKQDAQLLMNLRVQGWKDKRTIQKLEPRTKELAKDLEYYKSLKEFVGLGVVGMEILLTKLKYDNVPILEMIEEVKRSFDTAPDAAPDAAPPV
ncbi:uncharacterized protein B0J16DRAFT_374824 [Fusarium flagelliforme]|uniref:Uncharacterized protein n=1 Tax=Fusarium flagelliforme TaxID=2675880 RepID=A0A395MGM3_9HYPO|nr:uncharacterized protein B0J16DRAFT_374824 [Fusarium flagelliforme]KAH7179835.1 hypothetical protein B0J16DRAFT_374824 [Fusarium flagelliforme]RFN46269.1 hypothetical protein FIE12Z_9504 [Fusarium flagelliforme]